MNILDILSEIHIKISPLEKKNFNEVTSMATHSRVLAWRIPGTAEPGGLWSMGSHS